MILSESKIRRFIKNVILKEYQRASSSSPDINYKYKDSSDDNDNLEAYSGPLVSERNGKKYLGDPSIGLSPPGFWDNFRNELNSHIQKSYPELGFRIDNLGITRDLEAAADTGGNTARVAGSKHGAGLAQDCYFHTKTYGEYTSYKTMNPILSKDQKLVNAIIDFVNNNYSDKIVWGGSFGGGISLNKLPTGRGITEFHHFEFKNNLMPSFFASQEEELSKLGLSSSEITSTKVLASLYNKILGKET